MTTRVNPAAPAGAGLAPLEHASRGDRRGRRIHGAAVRVDGEMIDRPRLARAETIVDRHRQLAAFGDLTGHREN